MAKGIFKVKKMQKEEKFNCFSAKYRYFFSWRDPALQGVEEDWLGARNFCRKRCMDSVSLETSNENDWVKQRIVDGKVSIIRLSINYKKIILNKLTFLH